MHCLCVSRQSGGKALGAMWGEQRAREMFTDAGFSSVDVKRFPDDTYNNYFIATKAAVP